MKLDIKNSSHTGKSGLMGLFSKKQVKNDPKCGAEHLPELLEHKVAMRTTEELFRNALSVQESGDHHKALSLWASLKDQNPHFAYPYAAHAITQVILGRLDDAEKEISLALGRFPDDIETVVNATQIALMNSNWDLAEDRLSHLRQFFPDAAYTRDHAATLENTISVGRQNYFVQCVAKAVAAEAGGDWHGALSTWQILFAEISMNRSVILGLGRCAEATQNYDIAANAYATGLAAYPEDFEMRAKFAQLAAIQQNWPEAAARWRDNLARHHEMDGYADMAADAYLKADMADDAEMLLASAMNKFPNRLDLWIHYARTAEALGRWPDAVARWDRVLELSPEPFLARLRGEAVWRLDMQHMETNGTSGPSAEQPTPDDSTKRLVLNFENLCGKCQLGLVQRHYGAEPLGLFRFAAVSPEKILVQLEENFASLGDPNHLIVEETDFEYIIKDDRDFYWSHTYIKKAESSPEQLLNQQIKRIKFLKRELIEDLRQGAKIFVCTDSESAISDETLLTLLSAVSKYGDNTILGIRNADDINPRGSVKQLNDRILIGYINEPDYRKNGVVFDFEAWLDLMRLAVAFKVEQKSFTFS